MADVHFGETSLRFYSDLLGFTRIRSDAWVPGAALPAAGKHWIVEMGRDNSRQVEPAQVARESISTYLDQGVVLISTYLDLRSW